MFDLNTHIWAASFLNVLFLGLQLLKLVRSRNPAGLSVGMWVGFLYMQCVYTAYGYRECQWGLFWGMAASAAVSLTIVLLVFRYRRSQPR